MGNLFLLSNVSIGVWSENTLVNIGNIDIMQKNQKVKGLDASYVFERT